MKHQHDEDEDGAAMVVFPFRVEKDQLQQAAEFAKKADRTKAYVVRLALRKFLEGRSKPR